MGQIKNVIFDFGGVLVDWNPRYFYRSVFRTEEEMEHFLAHVCNTEWIVSMDAGTTFADAISMRQEQFPQYAKEIGLYREGWEQMLRGELPESVALLRRLKSEGFGLYGLTNWSAETIDVAFRRFEFFSLFDGIVVSGREKMVKPDECIYRLLLERYGLVADSCIFLDDNTANVEAACKVGIHGIVFDDVERVKQKLSVLLA